MAMTCKNHIYIYIYACVKYIKAISNTNEIKNEMSSIHWTLPNTRHYNIYKRYLESWTKLFVAYFRFIAKFEIPFER
jgi:hypothetical protein